MLMTALGTMATTIMAAEPRVPAPAPLGVAKIDITPEWPVRMYGYASRKIESQGVAGRLKAAALAIGGDAGEGPAIILTVDNGAVPAAIGKEVLRRVQAKTSLKTERFVLCNAHIHSGPDLDGMESLEGEQRDHMERYAKQLTDKLEEVVLKALSSRRPAHLAWASGVVTFAANRRVLKDGKWSGFGAVPDGAVDHSLPMLRVTDAAGKLMAVLVTYACHDTTLRPNFTQLHADWAGCAQEFIEADHPGAVALVSLGCGADSDPCPHGTVELCQQHGRAVADEVKKLLAGPFKSIEPTLTARMMLMEVPYDAPPPMEELKERAEEVLSCLASPEDAGARREAADRAPISDHHVDLRRRSGDGVPVQRGRGRLCQTAEARAGRRPAVDQRLCP